MPIFIDKGTTRSILVGPFLDIADGYTPVTTLAATLGGKGVGGIKVSSQGGNHNFRDSVTAVTHDDSTENPPASGNFDGQPGWYRVELNTTDTALAGPMIVSANDPAVHLPVWQVVYVLPKQIYDALFSNATGKYGFDTAGRTDVGRWIGNAVAGIAGVPDVNMFAIDQVTAAATNLALSALGIVGGSFAGTPTTTLLDTDLTEATNDHYVDGLLIITSGIGAGQRKAITAYNGTTKELTTNAFVTAPAASDTFVIV